MNINWIFLEETSKLEIEMINIYIVTVTIMLAGYAVLYLMEWRKGNLRFITLLSNIIQSIVTIFMIPILLSFLTSSSILKAKSNFFGLSYSYIMGALSVVGLLIIFVDFFLKDHIENVFNNNEEKMKKINQKIKHPCVVIENNRKPISAITAFLNGIYAEKIIMETCKFDFKDLKLMEQDLWKEAISENLASNAITAKDLDYSVVGEFFDSKNLKEYLEKKKEIIVKSIENFGNQELNFEVKEIGKDEDFIEEYLKEDNKSFYLIPINASMGKNTRIEWICLKWINEKDNWYILNGYNNDESKERQAKRNANCISGFFTGINNFPTLEKVWKNTRNTKKCKCFNFEKWANVESAEVFKNIKKDNINICKRFNYLKVNKVIFSFIKSEFKILKVTSNIK